MIQTKCTPGQCCAQIGDGLVGVARADLRLSPSTAMRGWRASVRAATMRSLKRGKAARVLERIARRHQPPDAIEVEAASSPGGRRRDARRAADRRCRRTGRCACRGCGRGGGRDRALARLAACVGRSLRRALRAAPSRAMRSWRGGRRPASAVCGHVRPHNRRPSAQPAYSRPAHGPENGPSKRLFTAWSARCRARGT